MKNDLWDQFRHLISFKRAHFRWRTFALFVGVAVSTAIYSYIINSVDNSNNFIFQIGRYLEAPKYNFFSGGEKGVYYQIASALETETEKGNYRFSVDNNKSSGGSENAIKVLTTPKSFGFVQEETVRKGDFIREELNFISPMYLERMHIIYRFKKGDQYGFSKENPPHLTSNSEKSVLELFANSKISTGPVGSGTRVIASYIMSEINSQIINNGIENDQEIVNLSMSEGLTRINEEYNENDNIDILFTIAGSPLKDVRSLLSKDEYTLISIDPSLVTQINKNYELNLRLTDFKFSQDGLNKGIYYTNSQNISTLGSYAWLISSKDIPSSDILKILKIIKDNKDVIGQNLGIQNTFSDHSQLDEIQFYELYKSKYERTNLGFWRSLLILVGTFSISTVLVFSFISFIVSYRKQSAYFHDIIRVIENNFPVNTTLDKESYEIDSPVIHKSQVEIINKVVNGIQLLMHLNIEINQDFQSGGITNNNFTFLVNNIELTMLKLQKHLAKRVDEIVERGTFETTFENLDRIRKYYVSGYLLERDYLRIKSNISGKNYMFFYPDADDT